MYGIASTKVTGGYSVHQIKRTVNSTSREPFSGYMIHLFSDTNPLFHLKVTLLPDRLWTYHIICCHLFILCNDFAAYYIS